MKGKSSVQEHDISGPNNNIIRRFFNKDMDKDVDKDVLYSGRQQKRTTSLRQGKERKNVTEHTVLPSLRLQQEEIAAVYNKPVFIKSKNISPKSSVLAATPKNARKNNSVQERRSKALQNPQKNKNMEYFPRVSATNAGKQNNTNVQIPVLSPSPTNSDAMRVTSAAGSCAAVTTSKIKQGNAYTKPNTIKGVGSPSMHRKPIVFKSKIDAPSCKRAIGISGVSLADLCLTPNACENKRHNAYSYNNKSKAEDVLLKSNKSIESGLDVSLLGTPNLAPFLKQEATPTSLHKTSNASKSKWSEIYPHTSKFASLIKRSNKIGEGGAPRLSREHMECKARCNDIDPTAAVPFPLLIKTSNTGRAVTAEPRGKNIVSQKKGVGKLQASVLSLLSAKPRAAKEKVAKYSDTKHIAVRSTKECITKQPSAIPSSLKKTSKKGEMGWSRLRSSIAQLGKTQTPSSRKVHVMTTDATKAKRVERKASESFQKVSLKTSTGEAKGNFSCKASNCRSLPSKFKDSEVSCQETRQKQPRQKTHQAQVQMNSDVYAEHSLIEKDTDSQSSDENIFQQHPNLKSQVNESLVECRIRTDARNASCQAHDDSIDHQFGRSEEAVRAYSPKIESIRSPQGSYFQQIGNHMDDNYLSLTRHFYGEDRFRGSLDGYSSNNTSTYNNSLTSTPTYLGNKIDHLSEIELDLDITSDTNNKSIHNKQAKNFAKTQSSVQVSQQSSTKSFAVGNSISIKDLCDFENFAPKLDLKKDPYCEDLRIKARVLSSNYCKCSSSRENVDVFSSVSVDSAVSLQAVGNNQACLGCQLQIQSLVLCVNNHNNSMERKNFSKNYIRTSSNLDDSYPHQKEERARERTLEAHQQSSNDNGTQRSCLDSPQNRARVRGLEVQHPKLSNLITQTNDSCFNHKENRGSACSLEVHQQNTRYQGALLRNENRMDSEKSASSEHPLESIPEEQRTPRIITDPAKNDSFDTPFLMNAGKLTNTVEQAVGMSKEKDNRFLQATGSQPTNYELSCYNRRRRSLRRSGAIDLEGSDDSSS